MAVIFPPLGTQIEPHTASTPEFAPPLVLLQRLLEQNLLVAEDWQQLAESQRQSILASTTPAELLERLCEAQLLTLFQTERIALGKSQQLRLGNYRILEPLSSSGSTTLYRAEHIHLRRLVAMKIVTPSSEGGSRLVQRFWREVRTVSKLQHPNIVAAIDAGELPSSTALGTQTLYYLVMEYIPGDDLEKLVQQRGPLSVSMACHIIHQIADALHEAHAQQLIHRDLKPANIRVTPDYVAKLLDFGLVSQPSSDRLTDPKMSLGTFGYMAPEQAQDASQVDARADIYSLGCTLFWALTGREPFPIRPGSQLAADLIRRWTQPPPSVRSFRPELPLALDTLIQQMMAIEVQQRPPDAKAVMRALLPFLQDGAADHHVVGLPDPVGDTPHWVDISSHTRIHQLLIIDDDSELRRLCRLTLSSDRLACLEAADGEQGLALLRERPFDLVLLDMELPGLRGPQILHEIRKAPPSPNLKVILCSSQTNADELSRGLLEGADDFIIKPFSILQLRARVKTALRLKDALDRADQLNHNLLQGKEELERMVSARDSDLVRARKSLVLTLAKLVDHRSSGTGSHLLRMQLYCRALAEEAAKLPTFASQIDAAFIDCIEECAPLHDIGKVAVPDHILLKPGQLEPEERRMMQAHTTIGAETLQEVAKHQGFPPGFLQMAIDITRYHHERWDGTGYPDRLAGADIPLSARIVAVADVYDALRSRRVYKPAISHQMAVLAITEASPGHFDPALMPAFLKAAPRFERIFRDYAE